MKPSLRERAHTSLSSLSLLPMKTSRFLLTLPRCTKRVDLIVRPTGEFATLVDDTFYYSQNHSTSEVLGLEDTKIHAMLEREDLVVELRLCPNKVSK